MGNTKREGKGICLLLLAAGMGSRYGGLKQLDSVGPSEETIMDYSIYDAIRAGFDHIVFVIRPSFEVDFREKVLAKYRDLARIDTVFQELTKLPKGFTPPDSREKPWGTNHAVMMGAEFIDEPFAVINADDFYGADSFRVMADALVEMKGNEGKYCMVGYRVGNTLSESGAVSRGVCSVNSSGMLEKVEECTGIERRRDGRIAYPGADGELRHIDENTPVSMNMWGFTPDYFRVSEALFTDFLHRHGSEPKSEFFIPTVVNTLMSTKRASVRVLESTAHWFGVTYAADRPAVCRRLNTLVSEGVYPSPLIKK